MNEYKAFVKEVISANTILASVDLGFKVDIGFILQLYGINGNNTDMLAATNAKKYIETCILLKMITVKTHKNGEIYLAEIYYADESGVEHYLNREMVGKGYAKPYLEEKKSPSGSDVPGIPTGT